MDEVTHRNLMQLSATSRLATVDASDLAPEQSSSETTEDVPAWSGMLDLGLEALLNPFRRK
jgi:hypothetical protein